MELTTQKFEAYLMDKFLESEPTILDDDISDGFDNWLSEQDRITIRAYASLYAHEQGKLLAETYIKEQCYE